MKVYAMGHPDGFVKIGQSVKPLERLSDLQAATPYELWLITTIECNDDDENAIGSVEHGLHRYYSAVRVKREWFEIGPEEKHALGGIKSIRTSVLDDVVFEQRAGVYCENPEDPALHRGVEGKTLVDYLEIARNRRAIA